MSVSRISTNLFTATLLAASMLTTPALSAPVLDSVQAGDVAVSQDGSAVTQSSDRGIINWSSFNTTENEGVRFIQPGTDSVTLNRVTGGNTTRFDGQLTANGNVWITNPDGVTFGNTAEVRVGGLVASTADIGNDDFMAGGSTFDKAGNEGATITNEGKLVATSSDSEVALLGERIVNNNHYIFGNTVLGAAKTYTLGKDENGSATFDAHEFTDATNSITTADNFHIKALGGDILIKAMAKNTLDNAINLSGVIVAGTNIDNEKGKVTIESNAGVNLQTDSQISALGVINDLDGGDIRIAGNDVKINSQEINTSVFGNTAGTEGGMAGGTAGNITIEGNNIELNSDLIGVGVKGAGGTISIGSKDTDSVTVSETSELNVHSQGTFETAYDGGEINISGKNINIGARMIANAYVGNGGTINIDADSLKFSGEANLTTVSGETGTLNINTTDLSLITGEEKSHSDFLQKNIAIGQTLDNGTNVSITTGDRSSLSSLSWSGDGNLEVNAPDKTLFLGGGGGHRSFGPVISTGNGNITLEAKEIELGTVNSLGKTLFANKGNVTVTSDILSILAASKIITNTGDLTLNINEEFYYDVPRNFTLAPKVGSDHGKTTVNFGGAGENNLGSLFFALKAGSEEKGTEINLGSGDYFAEHDVHGIIFRNAYLKKNTTLRGESRDTVKINAPINLLGKNAILSNVTVDGNSADSGFRGVFIAEGSHGSKVLNTRLQNGNSTIVVNGSDNVQISGNEINDTNIAAIGVQDSDNVQIDNNTISGAATGVFMTGSKGGDINNNTISGFTETGIRLQTDVEDTAVNNNTLTGGAIGIADVIGGNNTFDNNRIFRPKLYGFYVENTENTVVENNMVEGAESAAVAAFYTDGLKVNNNALRDSKTGIQTRTSVNSQFNNNALSTLTNSGISLYNESHNSVVKDNSLVNIDSGTALLAHNSDNVEFSGNKVTNMRGTEGVDGAGISILYSDNTKITGNWLSSVAGNGIEVISSNDFTLGENNLENINGQDIVIVESTEKE